MDDIIVTAVGGRLTWQKLDKYNPEHKLFWTEAGYEWHPDPERKHQPKWMRDEKYKGIWLPYEL